MTFEWPQITYLCLTLAGLVVGGVKLGKTGNYTDFWANIISTVIILFILYSGGFFG